MDEKQQFRENEAYFWKFETDFFVFQVIRCFGIKLLLLFFLFIFITLNKNVTKGSIYSFHRRFFSPWSMLIYEKRRKNKDGISDMWDRKSKITRTFSFSYLYCIFVFERNDLLLLFNMKWKKIKRTELEPIEIEAKQAKNNVKNHQFHHNKFILNNDKEWDREKNRENIYLFILRLNERKITLEHKKRKGNDHSMRYTRYVAIDVGWASDVHFLFVHVSLVNGETFRCQIYFTFQMK